MSSNSDTPSSSTAVRQLIEGLQRGEAAAQEQFLKQYAQGVFQLIARIVPCTQDAEEITQDTLIRALQNIHRYDPTQASLATWLHRIAYRLALNHLRHNHLFNHSPSASLSNKSPHPALVVSGLPADITPFPADDLSFPADSSSPPPPFHDDSLVPLLREALDYLPPDEQTLVHLFYYDDLPLSEIAYILEASPSTLATRLHRIRRKLHHIIQKLQQQ